MSEPSLQMDTDLLQDVAELSSAEGFLDYFGVPYQPSLVQVKRVLYLRLLSQVFEKQPCETFSEYKAAVAKAYCLLEKGVVLAHAAPQCQSCSGC
ncbi:MULTISPECIES: nitrogenase-stabilizing/protective protein NifW [Agarivorans]|jgi:nitrogenase-stabilizing/protective protein|uniref:Nitrogenase-stabilizing/protective protein NifW n=1 Tax=Agarivorans gilvus TaxID=680279 RepID=A0ABQ1I5C4_9ALTE|nr:nitrogenase-stabilizing/protective protein NifW [Agarivorans gilvus]GGB18264.1 hypothetical protein GCM10007414_34610 [Agarivorans gilvus]